MIIKESAPPSSAEGLVPKARDGRPPGHERPGRRFRFWFTAVNAVIGAIALIAFAISATGYLTGHDELPLTEGVGVIMPVLGSGVVLLAAAGNLALSRVRSARRRLCASSAWISLLCVAAIGVVWWAVFNDRSMSEVIGSRVQTPAQVGTYLGGHLAKAKPVRIPTGVFVQSVEFSGASDVKVTGYVWQRYNAKTTAPGIVLPEADDAYSAKKVYQIDHGRQRVTGWYFQATLRQRFNYKHYPLDRQSLWLRMWSNDMNRSAVLVPDFASYPPWKTGRKYGLDPQMVNEGWNTTGTTFSYTTQRYWSSFGGHGYQAHGRTFPELYFNISMRRAFVGPLVAQLVPVSFIVLLVFASLFVTTRHPERRAVFGFSTFAVIGFAASMLMVITVHHTSVREATGEGGMVYLEYFYAAMYLIILLVAVNAVMLPARRGTRYLAWCGNLLPKVAYWPLFFGLIFVATLYSFS